MLGARRPYSFTRRNAASNGVSIYAQPYLQRCRYSNKICTELPYEIKTSASCAQSTIRQTTLAHVSMNTSGYEFIQIERRPAIRLFSNSHSFIERQITVQLPLPVHSR